MKDAKSAKKQTREFLRLLIPVDGLTVKQDARAVSARQPYRNQGRRDARQGGEPGPAYGQSRKLFSRRIDE